MVNLHFCDKLSSGVLLITFNIGGNWIHRDRIVAIMIKMVGCMTNSGPTEN
jgi:hypothetical protein